MIRNSCLVLLSFVSVLTKVECQLADNTPPSMWMDDRDWHIRENETIGVKIAQAHSEDAEGGPLVYNLEPVEFYGSKEPTEQLPFRIDPETGTVYLNESLKGRAGQNLHLYVTVSDGQFTAKTEVNVNILESGVRYNPSQPKRPPFGKNSAFLNIPGIIPPRPPPVLPNFSDNSAIVNSPPILPKQPFFQQKTYPEVDFKTVENKSPVTQLRPISVLKKEVSITTTENILNTSTEEIIRKNVVDILSNSLEPMNQIVPVEHSVKSQPEIPITLIPILSVCGVFLTIGLAAVLFRKKIYIGRQKDSKDDMRKQSSGAIVIQQEDIGLNMLDWRGPRAFNNRYEPWQTEGNHLQIGNQLSGIVKNTDRWEFPRHRLKFFNILGEGAFGQVWKCEAQDLEDKDSGVMVVAVKTLKENATEKERSDLISELQVMKMLEPHPNVVRLLGCCTDKEPIFLIMEYISKGKLQSYLRNSRVERYYNNMHGHSKTLTSRDLTSFVYQVAKGMDFLSSNGIIHRDLAARNILITDEHTCKVADFGFARDIIASHIYERKSEGRLPIRWMAPESLYDNIFSVKSDVWSFGVLIWEVVTLGSTPYPGMSAVDVMKKVKDGYRLDKPEHCRRELYNIMYYCWDKDPKERPSFTECVELLEKLLMTETDYIELERFPDHSYYNMMSLSGEKL